MSPQPPTPASSSLDRLRAVRHLMRTEQEVEAKHHAKADINVTPLVDVVLVLLIIFMVVTPLIANGVVVELPRTEHHAKKADNGKDIIVSVTADEEIYLGARRFASIGELAAAVVAERRASPEKTVFLKGDHRASYGRMRALMEALHDVSIDDVILGTEELTGKR
jgi:biopolymer transport protein TolR